MIAAGGNLEGITTKEAFNNFITVAQPCFAQKVDVDLSCEFQPLLTEASDTDEESDESDVESEPSAASPSLATPSPHPEDVIVAAHLQSKDAPTVTRDLKDRVIREVHQDYQTLIDEMVRISERNERLTLLLNQYELRYGEIDLTNPVLHEEDIVRRLNAGEPVCLCHIRGMESARDLLLAITEQGISPALNYAIYKIKKLLAPETFHKLMLENPIWIRTANGILRQKGEPVLPTGDTDIDQLNRVEAKLRAAFIRRRRMTALTSKTASYGDLAAIITECAPMCEQTHYLRGNKQAMLDWAASFATQAAVFNQEGFTNAQPVKAPLVGIIEHVATRHSIIPDSKWPTNLSAPQIAMQYRMSTHLWQWVWIRACASHQRWDRVFVGFTSVGSRKPGREKNIKSSRINWVTLVEYMIQTDAPDSIIRTFLGQMAPLDRMQVLCQIDVFTAKYSIAFKELTVFRAAHKDHAVRMFEIAIHQLRSRARTEHDEDGERYKTALERLEMIMTAYRARNDGKS